MLHEVVQGRGGSTGGAMGRSGPIAAGAGGALLAAGKAQASGQKLDTIKDEDKAVRSIIGESDAKGTEMLAIAHALRNRGEFKGVYGLQRVQTRGKSLKSYNSTSKTWSDVPADTYQMASKAWAESDDGKDPTDGATHWLSDWDLEHSRPERIAFRKKMIETAVIGSTHFYKNK